MLGVWDYLTVPGIDSMFSLDISENLFRHFYSLGIFSDGELGKSLSALGNLGKILKIFYGHRVLDAVPLRYQPGSNSMYCLKALAALLHSLWPSIALRP